VEHQPLLLTLAHIKLKLNQWDMRKPQLEKLQLSPEVIHKTSKTSYVHLQVLQPAKVALGNTRRKGRNSLHALHGAVVAVPRRSAHLAK